MFTKSIFFYHFFIHLGNTHEFHLLEHNLHCDLEGIPVGNWKNKGQVRGEQGTGNQ